MSDKTYVFFLGQYKYQGRVLEETPTHWIIIDKKEGKIEIPKTAVRKEVSI